MDFLFESHLNSANRLFQSVWEENVTVVMADVLDFICNNKLVVTNGDINLNAVFMKNKNTVKVLQRKIKPKCIF